VKEIFTPFTIFGQSNTSKHSQRFLDRSHSRARAMDGASGSVLFSCTAALVQLVRVKESMFVSF